ncbi:MAG: imidazolonepropionase [Patescibacteria group bacterium]|jgi:imidazolonepropionase
MSSLLFRNIKTLVQVEEDSNNIATRGAIKGASMKELPTIDNAWLYIDNGIIIDFGTMDSCPEGADEVVEAKGRMVFPTWCDSHSHLVFAASREGEFAQRINGMSYTEIAANGGGILNSARRLGETSEEALLESALERLEEVTQYGTGLLEIKSGYGLDLENELKMLRVIRELKKHTKIRIKSTLLAAHALPLKYKEDRTAFLDIVCNNMIPQAADEGLAEYIDVFCDKGLKPKVHTNQFNCMGGIQAAIKHKAISVDHLEVVNDEEIAALLQSDTMATLLPSAPFFLNDHYPPARKMIDAGLPVALATDFNPGSTPSGRMSFVVSLACIKMKMTPEEAINAATFNGAVALEAQSEFGSIGRGKVGSVFMTKCIPSIVYLPYAFGSDLVERVFR